MRDDEKAERKRKRPLDELDGEPEEESEVYEIDRSKRAIQIAIAVVGSVAIVVAVVLLATGAFKSRDKSIDETAGESGPRWATPDEIKRWRTSSVFADETVKIPGRFGGVERENVEAFQILFRPEGWPISSKRQLILSREAPRPRVSYGDRVVLTILFGKDGRCEVLEIEHDN